MYYIQRLPSKKAKFYRTRVDLPEMSTVESVISYLKVNNISAHRLSRIKKIIKKPHILTHIKLSNGDVVIQTTEHGTILSPIELAKALGL